MTDRKAIAPRIAIPVPHSGDHDYAQRALPRYEEAVRLAGGDPVRVELDLTPAEVKKKIEHCDGVLLPGSRADLDPRKYGAERHAKTAPADAKRDRVDGVLLDEAYRLRKPLLGICYGLQSLNVYRSGTLLQHIESPVNHSAGRAVAKAHTVQIEPGSKLAEVVAASMSASKTVPVNSSHHQSAQTPGEGLRIVARCAEDGVVEALEGTDPQHFVLAVQWHPERSVKDDPEVAEPAQAIFRAFIAAVRQKQAEHAPELAKALEPAGS
jgi:putative glutamine amidotransferase